MAWSYLYEVPKLGKFRETKQNGGEWNAELLSTRVSVWGEKVLEIGNGDGCITILMYLLPQSRAL